jgi:RNA polymerase sigma factor (sigma-70 family)
LQDADASDLASQTAHHLMGRLDSYEDRGCGSFRAWCLRCARNAELNLHRQRSRHPEITIPPDQLPDVEAQAAVIPEDQTESTRDDSDGELHTEVAAAFAMLCELDRRIFRMKSIHEMTYSEIVKELNAEDDQLGLTESGARKRFSRARARLAGLLSKVVDNPSGSTGGNSGEEDDQE